MAVTIQLRRGTAAQWTTANTLLAQGEVGYETDTGLYKIGDGSTTWTSLAYIALSPEMIGVLLQNQGSLPSLPASGKLRLFSQAVAGRSLPRFLGPSGVDSSFQPALFGNGVQIHLPGTGTVANVIGGPALTNVGTVSHPTLAATNLLLSSSRWQMLSAATANAAAESRVAFARYWQGDAAGKGGFFWRARFGVSAGPASWRIVAGLTSSTAAIATTQSPSALTNCIILGNDAGDANMQIMHNDAAGAATKVNLGAGFPANTLSEIYELTFFAAPNAGGVVGWEVQTLVGGQKASGTITTDLPASTTFLASHVYANNNAIAAAVTLAVLRIYGESDV